MATHAMMRSADASRVLERGKKLYLSPSLFRAKTVESGRTTYIVAAVQLRQV